MNKPFMHLKRFLWTWIIMMPFAVFAQTGNFSDTVQLVKKQDLLNNKFWLTLPANAKSIPRVADIMAADPNKDMETRIFIEFGDAKLVLMASETFILASDNFLTELNKAEPASDDFSRKILTSGDSMVTILNTPHEYDSASQAILINSLLIKNPDQTVSRVDAYIDGNGFANKDEFVKLSEKIFSTITKGGRKINLSARKEERTIFGTKSKLIFSLPANYFLTVDEKYDFGVFKINQFRKLSDTTFASLTVYTGHHPSYFYPEYDLQETASTKVKGTFVSVPVDWLFFRDESKDLFLKEQFVPADIVEPGLIFHVAVTTNTKTAMDQMMKVAESTTLVK
jgi:hypothetical protein